MIKLFLRIEYGIAFAMLLFIYNQFDFSWWLFFILLFVPDLTMIGYAINTRIGAIIYNFGHSFNLPLLLLGVSLFFSNEFLLMVTIIWVAHILMDRCFGFGLKYEHSFNETHLQRL